MRNIRAEAERRAGYSVPDPLWRLLEERYPHLDPDTRVADIATDITEIWQALTGARHLAVPPADLLRDRLSGGSRPSPAALARIRALSTFYATQAGADRDVVRFRELALTPAGQVALWVSGGRKGAFPRYRLLDQGQVTQWVQDRLADEIGGTGHTDEHDHLLSVLQQDGSLATLDYIADGSERRQSVASHGTLGDLATLTERLANSYRWRPSEATMFVLTGRTPEVQLYIGSAEIRHHEDSALTRVTMTLDPALAPEQVMGIYIRLRNRLRAGGPPRTLSAKTYCLAGHIGAHVRIYAARPADKKGPGRRPTPGPSGHATFIEPVTGNTWQTLRARWNERCRNGELEPGWRYDAAKNFTRDAQAALTGLLFVNWQLPAPNQMAAVAPPMTGAIPAKHKLPSRSST